MHGSSYAGKTGISPWCRKRWELKHRLRATLNEEREHNHAQMQPCKMTHLKGWTVHKSLQERPKAHGVRTHENLGGNTSVYWGFPSWWNNLTCFHSGLQLGQACPELEYSRWETEPGCAYLLRIIIPLARCKKQGGSATPLTVKPWIKAFLHFCFQHYLLSMLSKLLFSKQASELPSTWTWKHSNNIPKFHPR